MKKLFDNTHKISKIFVILTAVSVLPIASLFYVRVSNFVRGTLPKSKRWLPKITLEE